MRIAICDDIVIATNAVSSLLRTYQKERPSTKLCELCAYNSSAELLLAVEQGEVFDLFLLDVVMSGINGIELAQKIRQHQKDAIIVFVTSSKHHALDAYGVFAAHYMLKPVSKEDFFGVMDKIIASQKQSTQKFVHISAPGRNVAVLPSNIVVSENVKGVIKFHLINGEQIESKVIRKPFKVVMADLIADPDFLWVHQSYVINLNHVKEFKSRLFIMNNGMEIPVPKPKFTDVKKAYLKYLAKERS